MLVFEIVIGLLLAGAALAHWARRLRAPYPALLALAGTLGAVVPGLPEITLDPELALALFVAPVLLDAAYDASPRDLRDNWLPVTGLVVVCVLCTTVAVALAPPAFGAYDGFVDATVAARLWPGLPEIPWVGPEQPVGP